MQNNISKSISKIAWGFIFVLIHINIGTVDILPDFVGYIFMLSAINELTAESKTISQLKPFGMILAVWNTVTWILKIFSYGITVLTFINILGVIINIYFTFRLLTECSMIAKKYQAENEALDKKIIRNRNIFTVTITLCEIISHFTFVIFGYEQDAMLYMSLILGFVALIVMLMTVSALFSLSKAIRERPAETDNPVYDDTQSTYSIEEETENTDE